MISGRATAEGTAEYFNSRRELGSWLERSGLHCSAIGFGSYRIEDSVPTHSEALKSSLLSGCNLIDTSTNYGDGASETLIGRALAQLIQIGVLNRDQLVVVSKVGYVQGQALKTAQERETQGQPFPEMVKYQDGCWHCLHPDFLKVQLDKSFERLGLECIDFYLLHNPEYFLMDAANRGSSQLLPALRDEFYGRIKRAFAFLEAQAEAGRIQGYGVSSNTLGVSDARSDSTSASRLWEVAQQVAQERGKSADDHHFRVIQLPLNLFESGPFKEKNTGPKFDQTALEFASKAGLAVLANRPLNAFSQQQLIRLSDFKAAAPSGDLNALLEQLGKLEQEFVDTIAPSVQTGEPNFPASELFRWSADLSQARQIAFTADRWGQIEDQANYQIAFLCDQITKQLPTGPWTEWQNRYLPPLRLALAAMRGNARAHSQKNSDAITARLNPLLPTDWQKETLSQKVLGILIQTPGVSCVLNGMRTADYVEDSLMAIKLPKLPVETVEKIYEAFKT